MPDDQIHRRELRDRIEAVLDEHVRPGLPPTAATSRWSASTPTGSCRSG